MITAGFKSRWNKTATGFQLTVHGLKIVINCWETSEVATLP